MSELSALAALGRTDELNRRFDELAPAIALDSGLAATLYHRVGAELRAHGWRKASVSYFQRCLEIAVDADCLYELGRFGDLTARYGADTAWLAVFAARHGRRLQAESLFARVKANYAWGTTWQYGVAFQEAKIAALLGDWQKARSLIQSEGQRGRLWELLHLSADFDSLRDDPAITGLIQQRN